MDNTVFVTVISGVLTYVAGELVIRLVVEPVQALRSTIGVVSHTLIERANVISNPGVPTPERIQQTSEELRKLSSQLQSHLFLIPLYKVTARLFGLPTREKILAASSALIGLSNSVFNARDELYKANTKRVETVCDSLKIYLDEGSRWPNDM